MKNNRKKIRLFIADYSVIILGLAISILFWIIESYFHSFIFQKGHFLSQLLTIDPHEIWMRLVVIGILIIFSVYAQIIVTRLRRAKEVTRRTNEELNQIFNTAADAMRIIDKDFNVLRVNQTFATLTGVGQDEAIGKKCYEIFHGPMCHTPDCPLTKILGGAKRIEGDTEKERKDGSKVLCIVTATPFLGEDGEVFGIVEDFKDISERKQAEEELKYRAKELARSNAELEQFAYVASHDLQEPLRMVTSYVQLLARRYTGKLDADADDFIAYAVDGAARMQKLITDLLAYSRVGRKGNPFAPTDCEIILNESMANLQEAIKENQAIITHDPLPTVPADPAQLTQLFQNLIGNAVKFHRKELPQIHISAQLREGEWVFSVRDNGIGIDPQYLDRIFIIFQRLHGKKEYSGTGIGLSIAKKIVERHGGRIWVESKVGQGATFYFSIPKK